MDSYALIRTQQYTSLTLENAHLVKVRCQHSYQCAIHWLSVPSWATVCCLH